VGLGVPTLFGLERSDLSKVLKEWPLSLEQQEPIATLAIQGALREVLYGASTIPDDKIESVSGLSMNDLEALAQRLWPRIDEALGWP
jgi:hypothetical protein